MRVLARILQGVGLLAILAGGFGLAAWFELDFLEGEYVVPILIGIVAAILVGVGLIVLSAVVSPGSAKISFPMFRPSQSIDGVDPDPQDKS